MYMYEMFPTTGKLTTTNKNEHQWNDVHYDKSIIDIAFYNVIFYV